MNAEEGRTLTGWK